MNTKMKKLDELKVGDFVRRFASMSNRIEKLQVDKVTKTMVFCSRIRYSKKDGNRVGDTHYSSHIAPWTEEDEVLTVKQIRISGLKKLIKEIACLDPNKVGPACEEHLKAALFNYQYKNC